MVLLGFIIFLFILHIYYEILLFLGTKIKYLNDGLITTLSFILSLLSTKYLLSISYDTGCSDGWNSTSIGRQGACSHHGGVVSNLNDIGWVIILLLIISGIIFYFYIEKKRDQNFRIYQEKNKQNEIQERKDELYKKYVNKNKLVLLKNAISNKKSVVFDYRINGTIIKILFLPKTINHSKGTTSGFCYSYNEKRTYVLDHIGNVETYF